MILRNPNRYLLLAFFHCFHYNEIEENSEGRTLMKRSVCGILSFLLLLTTFFAPCMTLRGAAAQLKAGDVDFDNKVTASDARLVLRNAVGLEKLSDDAMRCADVDRDNSITAADARLVLRSAVGLEQLKPLPDKKQTIVNLLDKIPQTALTFPNGKTQTLGSLNETGMVISVEPDSLPKGAKLSATPIDMATLKTFKITSFTERVIFPMKIECTGYDGSYFDDGVRITVPLMEDRYSADTDYSRFFFCYYDENTKEVRFLVPDEIDTAKHTMTVYAPHFSYWWGAKLTEEEKVEQFLDRACTEMVIAADKQKKAAAELEPYLKAKAEALGLTAEAAKDLVQCAANLIGGSFTFNDEKYQYAGDYISIGTNATTQLIRAYYENDASRAKDALSSTADAALQQAWKQLKFSERAGKVFKSEYVKEFVPGAIDTLISKFGAIGTVLGAAMEGDVEGAARAVGSALEDMHPAAALTTKAVAFVGNGLNTAFTYWKANQIEELYKLYKNGGTFLFGNHVLPRDRESFLRHLNTSSGFTTAKGVKRFYNMDKIGEVCKKYGWSFKDYASMPQKYRDIFEQRAEDGLMKYFETRLAQEAEIEKQKNRERECVAAMLNETNGALRCTNYEAFFGENNAVDYDLTARLERLYFIRSQLAIYVDENKLNRDSYQNWGRLLNLWVYYVTTEKNREDALDLFLRDLKSLDLLKADYKLAARPAIEEFFGTWSVDIHEETEGYVDYANGIIYNGVIVDARYTVEIAVKNGATVVSRSISDPTNPYSTPSTYKVTLGANNFKIRGRTLIVDSPNMPGWLRLTLLSSDLMTMREQGTDGSSWTYTLSKQ